MTKHFNNKLDELFKEFKKVNNQKKEIEKIVLEKRAEIMKIVKAQEITKHETKDAKIWTSTTCTIKYTDKEAVMNELKELELKEFYKETIEPTPKFKEEIKNGLEFNGVSKIEKNIINFKSL